MQPGGGLGAAHLICRWILDRGAGNVTVWPTPSSSARGMAAPATEPTGRADVNVPSDPADAGGAGAAEALGGRDVQGVPVCAVVARPSGRREAGGPGACAGSGAVHRRAGHGRWHRASGTPYPPPGSSVGGDRTAVEADTTDGGWEGRPLLSATRGRGVWHKALVVGSVSLWRRLLAYRL